MGGLLNAIFNPKPKPAPVKVQGIIKRIGFRPGSEEYRPVTLAITLEGDSHRRLYGIEVPNWPAAEVNLRVLLLKAGDWVSFSVHADGTTSDLQYRFADEALVQATS